MVLSSLQCTEGSESGSALHFGFGKDISAVYLVFGCFC